MWQWETVRQIRGRDRGGEGCVPALSSHKVLLSSEPRTRQQWVWVTDGSQKTSGPAMVPLFPRLTLWRTKSALQPAVWGRLLSKCSFTSTQEVGNRQKKRKKKTTTKICTDWDVGLRLEELAYMLKKTQRWRNLSTSMLKRRSDWQYLIAKGNRV